MMNRNTWLLGLALLLVMVSCRNEDEIRFPDFQEAANVRLDVDPEASFLNFEDLQNARFAFTAYSENTNLESVELIGTYVPIDPSRPTVPNVTLATFTQADFDQGGGQFDVAWTSQDIVDFFDLGSIDSMQGGDAINIVNRTTLDDGRVFDNTPIDLGNYGTATRVSPNIQGAAATASFTATLNTFVGCPSSLAGTYDVVTIATSTDPCCPEAVQVETTVNLTQTGPTSYTLPNFAAGTYSEWYCAPYSLCASTFDGLGANLLDVCGNVTLTAGYWGSQGTGTVDPATGVITISWNNQFGDSGTSVYTPR